MLKAFGRIGRSLGMAPLVQRRNYETEAVEVLAIKRGEFIFHEGVIGKVVDRSTTSRGRGAATGEMRYLCMSGIKKGREVVASGLKFNRLLEVNKLKLMFTEVNEEKETLVFQLMETNAELKLEGKDKFFETTGEEFGDLIHDGDVNTLKWLTPDMMMQGLTVEEQLLELKMPPTGIFTISNVSQLGGKYMALIEENDEQIPITAHNARPGDKAVISLPRGRFAKIDK
eukprot:TRINITY_DN10616_c0_g1_i1.p1 TRINITY_DN10616_c0_g1~~TRINITY_DN10616_c0_g1_i1.p1  ORF type:complete len:249 (+),score=86.59 TRINITY_DN10616_c0_g1_i1:65-748(+)